MRQLGRAAVAAALLCAALAALAPPGRSGASYVRRSAATATATADRTDRYLHLHSQGTDPAGTTGYAVKRLTLPVTRAATGADAGLAVHLGAFRLNLVSPVTRVLVVQAADPLPSGVAGVTVSASLTADATYGAPIGSPTLSPVGSTTGTASATLAAGERRQLNVDVASTLLFPTATLEQRLKLAVTYAGYTGSFLTYDVPMRLYTGLIAAP